MEGDTHQAPKKPLSFHSDNIAGTKAKEKREVFVKVEEKKTLKQSAEEFQKKFAEAKAHIAETRAKIENPGADANGVIRSRAAFTIPWKTIFKILIPLAILATADYLIYSNWSTINYYLFEVSETRANDFIDKDPERYIKMYGQLIANAKTAEEKARLHLARAISLEDSHPGKYISQIKTDLYDAEEAYSSCTTASHIADFEDKYGSTTAAAEWRDKLAECEGKELTLGNG